LNREKLLDKEAAARLSHHLTEYAGTKDVYLKINFVNADHVHALVDLPTNLSIEELIQLLKGNTSTGLTQTIFCTENSLGAEDTALSQSRNLMLTGLLPTLPGKKNIIASAHLPTSCGNSSSVTACVGKMGKAVENGLCASSVEYHRPKGRC
jgi:REP element-mobilizing transposase RayT